MAWRALDKRRLALALALGPALGCGPREILFPEGTRCDWSEPEWGDFYADPVPGLADAAPGALLRAEHLLTLDRVTLALNGQGPVGRGTHIYRILYASESLDGSMVPVSGRVAIPRGDAPSGGFPVLAHGHATLGFADHCAPSDQALSFGFESVLNPVPARLAASGHVVVSSDYPGLGTPGPHGYLLMEPTGRAVLDSVRATSQLCDAKRGVRAPPSEEVVFLGHSQGGHAVLAAHALAPTYAPEVEVLGTMALAPVGELVRQIETLPEPGGTVVPGILALSSWMHFYPELGTHSDWLREPWDTDLPDHAEDVCVIRLAGWLKNPPRTLLHAEVIDALLDRDWETLHPLHDLLEANTPGHFTSDAPVRIVAAGDDQLIHPDVPTRLTQRLCGCGTPTSLEVVDDEDHYTVMRARDEEVEQWVLDRFGREPALSSCEDLGVEAVAICDGSLTR